MLGSEFKELKELIFDIEDKGDLEDKKRLLELLKFESNILFIHLENNNKLNLK